jgi:thiamine-phosphate pyrophosphorylase
MYGNMIAITNRHLLKDGFVLNAGKNAPETLNSGENTDRYWNEYLAQIDYIASLHPAAVVLREKDLSEEEYIGLAEKVLKICEKHGTELYLHKYLRAAQVLNHKKIHLPLGELERLAPLPDGYQYGTSVHSVDDAARAQQLGVSWMFAGNVYETDCKKGLPGRGLDFLTAVCRESSVPVYGIGGITPARLPEIMAAGAAGGCMMSGFMKMERR